MKSQLLVAAACYIVIDLSSAVKIKSLFPIIANKVESLSTKFDINDNSLRKGIAKFYDKSSNLWESIWGEHMHHGYYETKPDTIDDHRIAQVSMIDKSLEWAKIGVEDNPLPVVGLDVGCGIGGSSRHISKKFGTIMKGITLSSKQQQRAEELTRADGLSNKCSFEVVDALNQPFKDNSFDLVWSMESGEHMPQKQRFVNELARVCAPNGNIIIVTWCHRDLRQDESSLPSKESKLLDAISKAYFLPKWCSSLDYIEYCKNAGLQNICREDWTDKVKYFWPAVIRSSFTRRGLVGLIKSGPMVIRGAFAVILMIRGYSKGVIRFCIITAQKPST